MKIHGVLYLIILFTFDSCDSKCDEYIIILKETACVGKKNFQPMTLSDIKLNELTYPYNSTRVYSELDSFKECILEVECDSFNTNACLERERVETEDKTEYDLNIIYVNTQNNSDNVNNNETADNHFRVVCDYAEDSCDNAGVDKEHFTKQTNNSKDGTSIEAMKYLELTLKRDEGSEIQPIFTGFSSKKSKTGSKKATFLDVHLVCDYKEYTKCKSNATNKTVNVYLKSEYVKNNTKIKYTGCNKQLGDKKNTFNIECDATNFTYINQDILFTSPNNSEHESLSLHCQITTSNLTTKANLVNFNKCYSNQNVSNSTNFEKQNLTIFLNKNKFTENTTELTTMKVPLSSDEKNNTDGENWFKMHITADKNNNCSQNPLLSINEGKIIDNGVSFVKNNILKYEDAELKLLNCLNYTHTNNNVTGDNRQTKLVIIFKNETDSNEIDEEMEELNKLRIIIVCNRTYHDEHKHILKTNDDIAFTCKFVNVNNKTTTKNNSSDIAPEISMEEIIRSHENNQSIIDEEHQDNSSSYSKEKTDLKMNYNLTVAGNKTDDSKSNGENDYTIGNENSLDRLGLIVLVTIAGVGLIVAITLRKCVKKAQYSPAPVREPQDLEDTAF